MGCFLRYFIFIFFVFLFILSFSFLPEKQNSQYENRKLASRPVLLSDSRVNLKFGSELDAYLKDHFFFREEIIRFYAQVLFDINKRIENNRVMMGEEDWFFHKDITFKKYAYDEADIKRTAALLSELNQILNKNGIQFYLVFQPSKNRVYPEYFLNYIHSDLKMNNVLKLQTHLSEHTTVKSVYLLDHFLKNKKTYPTPLFEKPDMHPTGWGYYLVYREILNLLHADFPDISPYPAEYFREQKRERWEVGSCRRLLGFDEKVLLSHHLEPITQPDIAVSSDSTGSYLSENPKGHRSMYYIGTSVGLEVQKLLKLHFKKLFFVRENTTTNEERLSQLVAEVIREKPDIFLMEVPEDRVLWGAFEKRLKMFLKKDGQE